MSAPQNPYGQQQYYDPYGQAGGYPAAPYQGGYLPYPPTEAPSKGPGMTALILALLALAISLVLSVVCGMAYGDVIEAMGTTEINAEDIPDDLQGKMATAGLTVIGQIVPTIMGIIALVLSGRAMGRPGSKGLGILGLITALAAPVISFIVFFVLLAQSMPQS